MGIIETAKGAVKKGAGEITNNSDLSAEGEAQMDKGQEETEATKARAEAQAHEAKADAAEAKQKAAEDS